MSTNHQLGSAYDDYFRALAGVDLLAAEAVVLRLLDDGVPVDTIAMEVLTPAQAEVGRLWERGVWSVADEHAATAVAEAALAALQTAAVRRAAQRGPGRLHVAVACAEGEWHALPARLAAIVAGAGDLQVTMLGPSLPAEHLQRRLAAGDIDALALSCTLPTNLIGAARSIAAAHEVGVPVIVGGRAFGGPERAAALGADAWAADGVGLREWTPRREGRDVVVPPEVLWLDAVEDRDIAPAYDRMLDAFPRLAEMNQLQQARTREDMRWMSRFTAAAVLTGDATMLDEFFAWLNRVLADRVPMSVVTATAYLVADVLEPQAPTGAELLRGAASRATSRAARPEGVTFAD